MNIADAPSSTENSRHRIWLCLLLLAALAIRIVLAFLRPDDLLLDADGYLGHSQELLNSGSYAGPFSHQPTAFRPPAYPIALTAFQSIGLSAPMSVLVIHLLSIACIVLCTDWLLSVSLPWTRLITVGMIVLDPLLLRYSLLPMTEVPCAAILLLAVAGYSKCCREGYESWTLVAGSGLLFAIAALTRPTAAVCLALVLFFDLCRSFFQTAGRRAEIFRRAIITILMFAIGLSPWVIRNAIQFGEFIPATTHGGYTLALGNNPAFYRDVIHGSDRFPWDGPSLDTWQRETLERAKVDGIDPASETQLDAWYYDYAKSSMKKDPEAAFKAVLLRISRFWALSTAESSSTPVTLALAAWYGVLWAGLFIKLTQALSWRWDDVLFAACILGFALMHTVYWTDTRMRTPVMPMLIILSVSGWSTVSGWSSFRRQ